MGILEIARDDLGQFAVEKGFFLAIEQGGQRTRNIFNHQLIIFLLFPLNVLIKSQFDTKASASFGRDRVFLLFNASLISFEKGSGKITVVCGSHQISGVDDRAVEIGEDFLAWSHF